MLDSLEQVVVVAVRVLEVLEEAADLVVLDM
jgi:hypothetical protein